MESGPPILQQPIPPPKPPGPTRSQTMQLHPNPLAAAANDSDIARRVWAEAKHDVVRDALGRMLGWVEELSTLLTQSHKTQAELETTLTLTRSNLQLALANTEMLEDALKRDGPGRGKDVGWRRWSEREGVKRESVAFPGTEEQRRRLIRSDEDVMQRSLPINRPDSALSLQPTENGTSSRFWKRFATPGTPSSSKTPSPTSMSHYGDISPRLNSPSMPSLSSPSRKEEELAAALENEKKARRKIADEKTALEAELESLSQALFEEANKMVASERRRRAEMEEELQHAREEKDALKGALRIIETENSQLRLSGIIISSPSFYTPATSPAPSRSSPTANRTLRSADLPPEAVPLPPDADVGLEQPLPRSKQEEEQEIEVDIATPGLQVDLASPRSDTTTRGMGLDANFLGMGMTPARGGSRPSSPSGTDSKPQSRSGTPVEETGQKSPSRTPSLIRSRTPSIEAELAGTLARGAFRWGI